MSNFKNVEPLSGGCSDTASAPADTRKTQRLLLGGRLSGPGGLYNLGNMIALSASVLVQLAQAPATQSISATIYACLFGNPGATWLTIAMLIFFVSGETYHRAYAGGDGPDIRLVKLGDLVSGVAALALTAALFHFGDLLLAVVAGTLLFGGKVGSAAAPSGTWPVRLEYRGARGTTQTLGFDAFRWAVVLSRFPSLAALGVEIGRILYDGAPLTQAVLPAIMVLCFLLWLRADVLLMRVSGAPDPKGAVS